MSVFAPVHILFENPDWLPPLTDALTNAGFTNINSIKLSDGILDTTKKPQDGIWINRISPSSHTRGNDNTVQLAREVLYWLELHECTVLNGLGAFEIEMSKFRQDLLLRKYNIQTPKTILVVGEHRLITASEQFEGPFITKHNQGGKGLGIQLYNSKEDFKRSVLQQGIEPSPDGKYILQQYIAPAREQITRVEIVGDKFLFAMNSSTKDGFELCPSDVCQMQLQNQGPDVCPIDGSSDKFSISHLEVNDPLVQQYIRLMRDEQIDVAGIEFVEASDGQRYTYDINGTTNYNSTLGEQIGISGMDELVKYIQQRLVA